MFLFWCIFPLYIPHSLYPLCLAMISDLRPTHIVCSQTSNAMSFRPRVDLLAVTMLTSVVFELRKGKERKGDKKRDFRVTGKKGEEVEIYSRIIWVCERVKLMARGMKRFSQRERSLDFFSSMESTTCGAMLRKGFSITVNKMMLNHSDWVLIYRPYLGGEELLRISKFHAQDNHYRHTINYSTVRISPLPSTCQHHRPLQDPHSRPSPFSLAI